jgi:tetratricopeptide (TPR) repeat protein
MEVGINSRWVGLAVFLCGRIGRANSSCARAAAHPDARSSGTSVRLLFLDTCPVPRAFRHIAIESRVRTAAAFGQPRLLTGGRWTLQSNPFETRSMQLDPSDSHESQPRSDEVLASQNKKRTAAPVGSERAADTIITFGEVFPPLAPPPPIVGAPRLFGNYQLLERLGKGGMGIVWKAKLIGSERVVALKQLVASEFASAAAIARFRVEARAAAALDHPGIVPVYDIGEVGQCPYYTMPVVEGGNLRTRLDAGPIDPSLAARLLLNLAEAVQHAHDRGLIHRDLKPENVLLQCAGTRVPESDDVDGDNSKPAGKGTATLTPRLTDFGLARSARTGVDGVTRTGSLLGTPSYMAPEQAAGDNEKVGPLADVYGLGAVLYCCLTGRPPFQAANVLETVRQVREQEPVPVRQLNAAVPRDLETICLKCLEKEPHRRYHSAADLALDMRLYQRGEPIRAVPAGTLTRLRKWVRRRPAVAGLLAAVVTSLLLGIIAFAWQTSIARLERDAAIAARAEAKRRADELQQVSDFQAQMLGQVDPTAAGLQLAQNVKAKFTSALAKADVPESDRAKQVDAFVNEWNRVNATDTARDLIDTTILKPAVEAVDKQFADQPLVDATLRQVLASRYGQLGLYDVAFSLQDRALTTRRRLLGDDHPDTVRSIEAMGLLQQYRGKFPEAERLYREVLEVSRRVLGDSHSDTLSAMSNVGDILRAQGKFQEAETFCREALRERRRLSGGEHPLTLACLDRMGYLLCEEGKFPEAEACYHEALEKRRRILGDDHTDTLQSIENLGVLLNDEGMRSKARECFLEVLAKRRRILGETHPLAIATLQNLASTLSLSGKRSEAEALYREALAVQESSLGADHPQTLLTLNNLAVALIEQGKLAEAEPMCREMLERRRRVSGLIHPDTLLASNNLSSLLRRMNRLAEAEVCMRQTLETAQRTLGDDHPDTLVYRHNLGVALREQHKAQEAEPYLRDVVDRARRKMGPEHLTTLVATTSLSSAFVDENRFQETIELLTPVESAVRKSCTGSNARTLAVLLMNLGKSRAGMQEFTAAETELLEARKLYESSRGPRHKETLECTKALVDFYATWHINSPGKGYDAKASEWNEKLQETPPPVQTVQGGKG